MTFATPIADLDRWILKRRPPRHAVDPLQPYLFFAEEECSREGELVTVNALFLSNRECPWRCLMCDLWKNTLNDSVPAGAIPAQIDYALARLPAARQVKLYNSGSFFDARAIPPEDFPGIAARVARFDRVIVESHPTLIGASCLRFRDMVPGRLEVAMGLETVHPRVLPRLNKRMTLESFARAAEFLTGNSVDLRAFILVNPPYLCGPEALEWTRRSLDFAFECGAAVASVIPTRGGNGALEALAQRGEFERASIPDLEAALEYGLALRRGRVFADVWDLRQFSKCDICYDARTARLERMNREQRIAEAIECGACGGSS